MLYISRWKMLAILLTTFVVCAFAVPNFFPKEVVQSLAEMGAAPCRARARPAGRLAHPARGRLQRGPQGKGRGAARRRAPRGAREQARQPGTPSRSAATPSSSASAKAAMPSSLCRSCANCRSRSAGCCSATGQRTVDVVDAGGGLFRLTVTEPALVERIRQSVEQSIQIIERRVNELGTVEPSIQRQGVDRMLVQVPGLQDPQRLKELLGKTAKLTFRMVDMTTHAGAGAAGQGAAGFRNSERQQGREQPALCDREARRGVGRGPDRRAAGLRPAHQRADRHPSASTPTARAASPRRRRRMSGGRSPSCSTTR